MWVRVQHPSALRRAKPLASRARLRSTAGQPALGVELDADVIELVAGSARPFHAPERALPQTIMGDWPRGQMLKRHPIQDRDGRLVYSEPIEAWDDVSCAQQAAPLPQ